MLKQQPLPDEPKAADTQLPLSDPATFTRMAEKAKPRLYAIALRRTRCAADAEDVVQEALMKAWRTIDAFRGEAMFSTWLTRILLNEVHQLQRRRDYRDLEFQDSLTVPEQMAFESGRLLPGSSPELELLRSDASDLLRRAIKRLPKAFRQVLQLEIAEEKTCVEMAKELAISVPALKSRRLRARLELMKRMAAV